MANYVTKFSSLLSMRDADAAQAALDLLEAARAAYRENRDPLDDPLFSGFEAALQTNAPPMRHVLWIRNDEGGNPEGVIEFVQACASQGLTVPGRWSFLWSFDCDAPRIGAFGGGACVVDLGTGTIIADIDLGAWADATASDRHAYFVLTPEGSAYIHDTLARATPEERGEEGPAFQTALDAFGRVTERNSVTITGAGPD